MADEGPAPADDREWYFRKRFLIPLAVIAMVVIGALSGPESERPRSGNGNTLPTQYQTFERVVANQSDCGILAAMGKDQRENGDQMRWAIVARRVTEVGCDVTADEFDGFFGF